LNFASATPMAYARRTLITTNFQGDMRLRHNETKNKIHLQTKVLSPEIKWPKREADHSIQISYEVKSTESVTSTPCTP